MKSSRSLLRIVYSVMIALVLTSTPVFQADLSAEQSLVSDSSEMELAASPCIALSNTVYLPLLSNGPGNVISTSIAEDAPPTDDPDKSSSAAVVALIGASSTSFNPEVTSVQFKSSCDFPSDLSAFTILHNDNLVPDTEYARSDSKTIVLTRIFGVGRHHLVLFGIDSEGGHLSFEVVFWIGDYSMTVTVVDKNDQPVPGATVRASLGDDQTVFAEKTTDGSGEVVISNLPDRTVILEASAAGNRTATAAVTGSEGSVQLKLLDFNAPSAIDNNDFSLGTDGWFTGTAPVTIISHTEVYVPPPPPPPPPDEDVALSSQREDDLVRTPHQRPNQNGEKAQEAASLASDSDLDLELHTSGEGAQSVSRTFETKSTTKNVTVRFRFVTSEVPGGYFGTEYNDYFRVTARVQGGSGQQSRGNSMNAMGLSAFDANGATEWFELSLSVNQGVSSSDLDATGDTVQVDVVVANVADGALDSSVIVDVVEEKTLEITKLALKDIDNTTLQYLSADSHTYFGGNTRIHGTITVKGDKDDKLTSLKLEVLQNGTKKATADLASGAQTTLLNVAFGTDEKLEITNSQLLFELPSAQAANIDTTSDGSVSFRVVAKSTNGEEAKKDHGSAQVLARYTGNRYGGRDGTKGGDGWVKPDVKKILDHFTGITVGDISNMNGGSFPPHNTHTNGQHVDGWYSGYNSINAATAATMITYLNDNTYGSKIETVYVTYVMTDTNTFWTAIKDETLDDNRKAKDVIKIWSHHDTHFHWYIVP